MKKNQDNQNNAEVSLAIQLDLILIVKNPSQRRSTRPAKQANRPKGGREVGDYRAKIKVGVDE
jgi:hypothetical protein